MHLAETHEVVDSHLAEEVLNRRGLGQTCRSSIGADGTGLSHQGTQLG